jgi:hypothetical protein
VTVPPYLAEDGLARAREVAEAIAAITQKPLEIIGVEQPRRRRRGRRQAPSTA